MDKRTRGDRIAEFFGSDDLVKVFRPLAEEVFRQGGSPEDLGRISEDMGLRQTLARDILGVPAPVFTAPEAKSERAWQEKDGIIYFSVTSLGTTGEGWVKRLEGNGFHVGDYAKQVLRCPGFKPTSGVTTEVAVIKGMLFEDQNRITSKIRAAAEKRKLSKPNAELACLIREKFTDKEIEAMDLCSIVAMHEPIKDSDGDPDLLGADRDDDGRWLDAYDDRSDDGWNRDDGFAFVVSQVGP